MIRIKPGSPRIPVTKADARLRGVWKFRNSPTKFKKTITIPPSKTFNKIFNKNLRGLTNYFLPSNYINIIQLNVVLFKLYNLNQILLQILLYIIDCF